MAADGSIKIDTKIDQSSLKKNLSAMSNTMAKGLKAMGKTAAVAVAAVAAVVAIIAKGAKVYVDFTREVSKNAKMAGVSTKAFQQLEYATGKYGLSTDALTDSLKEMQLRADEFVTTGAGSAAEAFDRIGLSQEDLNNGLADAPGLFTEVIDRVGDLDKAAQIRVLDEIFGGTGAEQMMGVVEAGVDSMAALREEAESLGVVMSQDVIDSGLLLGNAFDDLSALGKGFFTETFSALAPMLAKAAQNLSTFVSGNGGVTGIIHSIQAVWFRVLNSMGNAFVQSIGFFKVLILSFKSVWLTEFIGIELAVVSLASFITDTLLGSITNLLSLLGKLPYVGEVFDTASKAVSGFNDTLQGAADKAKEASREAISATWEDVAATKAATAEKIAVRNAETADRIEGLGQVATAEREALLVAAKETAVQKKRLAQIQQLTALESKYVSSKILAQSKFEDGFITQEELTQANISAAETYAEALYDIGVTAETAAEDGGEALKGLLTILKTPVAKNEAAEGGEEVAESVVEGFGSGLEMNAGVFLGAIQSLFSLISGGINAAASFDPATIIEALEEILDGVTEFLMEDLGSIPIFFDAGMAAIEEFGSGLIKNLPAIAKTLKNVIKYMAESLKKNGPAFATAFVEVLGTLAGAVISALPDLIVAALEIVKGLVVGLTKAAPTLIRGLMSAIVDVALYVAQNLSSFILLGENLILSVQLGLIKALPILLAGLVDMLPDIITALVSMQPMIIAAIIKVIPDLIVALLSMIPQILMMIPEIGIALITGIINGIIYSGVSLFDAVESVFTDFIDAVKDFFGIHSPSTVFSGFGGDLIQGMIDGILGMGGFLLDAVTGLFGKVLDAAKSFIGGVGDVATSIVSSVANTVSGATSAVVDTSSGIVSSVGSTVSGAASAVSGFFGFADGTDNAQGGMAIVGEDGPELMNVPKGSRIYTAAETAAMLSAPVSRVSGMASAASGASSVIINLHATGTMNIDGREIGRIAFEYLDEMAGIA